MPDIHFTLAGTVIAFAFLGLTLSILHWMLNPSETVKMTLQGAHQKWTGTGAILVPVTGSNLSNKALELAADIAQREHRMLVLLYVMEIPMALPSTADIPELREHGEDVLIRLQGAGQKLGAQVEGHLLRARNAGSAIVAAARDQQARMIVVPAREQARPDVAFGRTVEHILHFAPCDVLIYRPVGGNRRTPKPAPADATAAR